MEIGELMGCSGAIERIRELVERAARGDRPVLITGEPGSGKEVVARELHRRGAQKDRPFVAIECSSLPRSLFESELFGVVKGAFTGADRDRAGLLEIAEDGVAFLDEIGELDLDLQAKILRLLQEREFRPVGAREPVPLRARIVAATNVDIEAAVREGRFRSDLFYRLDVIRIPVPPLRDRPEDIEFLAQRFITALAQPGDQAREWSSSALEKLRRHRWPGNVRELRNCVERILALGRNAVVRPEDIPLADVDSIIGRDVARHGSSPRPARTGFDLPFEGSCTIAAGTTLEEIERQAIEAALERHDGRVASAARELGLNPSTVYRKLERYARLRSHPSPA